MINRLLPRNAHALGTAAWPDNAQARLVGPVHVTPLPQLRQFYRAASQLPCAQDRCAPGAGFIVRPQPHPEGS